MSYSLTSKPPLFTLQRRPIAHTNIPKITLYKQKSNFRTVYQKSVNIPHSPFHTATPTLVQR